MVVLLVFIVDVPGWRVVAGRRLREVAGHLLPVVLEARGAGHDGTLAPFAALHELRHRHHAGEVEHAERRVRCRARRITSAVVKVRIWKQPRCHVLSFNRANLQSGDCLPDIKSN